MPGDPLSLAGAFATQPALASFASPLAQAGVSGPWAPWGVLLVTVLAGLAMAMLLPGKRSLVLTRLGGVLLLAAAGAMVAALVTWLGGVSGLGPFGHREGMSIYFWIFAAIAILGSVRVVTHNQPVYSALYFVLTVFASAGLFVLLWAEFLAAALVLIYAGAILVTYVFVIMLAAEASPAGIGAGAKAFIAEHDRTSREPWAACTVGFALLGVLLFVIFNKSVDLGAPQKWAPPMVANVPAPLVLPAEQVAAVAAEAPRPIVTGASQELGLFLFSNHILSLQIAGLLLTVAMIGAIVIARKRIILPAGVKHEVDVVSSTAAPTDDNPHSIPVVGTRDPRQKVYPET
jgi:NADH-quinone oxidoreductase subunit J